MALTFPQIDELIASGKAVPDLERFILYSVGLSIAIRTGQHQEQKGDHETIVAGMALQRLMQTKDGRRLLGIRASNKVYSAKNYGVRSEHLEIARRLGCGELTRDQALVALSDQLAKAQIFPDPKTLKSLLRDLEEQALTMRQQLEFMMRSAGWDGAPETLEENIRRFMASHGDGKNMG